MREGKAPAGAAPQTNGVAAEPVAALSERGACFNFDSGSMAVSARADAEHDKRQDVAGAGKSARQTLLELSSAAVARAVLAGRRREAGC